MAEHNLGEVEIGTLLQDQQSVEAQIDNGESFNLHDFPQDGFDPQPISKKVHDVRQDIKILDDKYECISNYESHKLNLKETLMKIGVLAGNISYNDLGDKESDYIRNRYGYIKRNKNKSINKNGIYFERLSYLKTILSNDHNYLAIPELEIDDLKNHLSNLKQKISHILSQYNLSRYYQNFNINETIDFSVSICDITDFSKKYYDQVILTQISIELGQLEDLEFSIKEDRYYFARVFGKLGELFNEWLDGGKQNNTMLMNTFKVFHKLRINMIDQYGKLQVEETDFERKFSELEEQFNEWLKKASNREKNSEMLMNTLKIFDELGQYIIHQLKGQIYRLKRTMLMNSFKMFNKLRDHVIHGKHQFEAQRELVKKIGKLEKLFNEWAKVPSHEQNRTILMVTFKMFNKLRDHIVHQHGKVKIGVENENESMNKLIIDVINHLNKVIVNNKKHAVLKEVSFSYEDCGNFHDKMDQLLRRFTEKSSKNITETENTTGGQDQNNRNSKRLKTNEDIKHILDRLLSRACGIIDGTTPPVKSQNTEKPTINLIEDELLHLDKLYQENLSQLEQNDKKVYPNILNLSNKDNIKIFCENISPKPPIQLLHTSETLMDKFDSKIELVKEEIDYFVHLITSRSTNRILKHSIKFRYIIQHIFLVIGQLVRDVENLDICKQSKSGILSQQKSENFLKFSAFRRFSSSLLITEGKIKSKEQRNCGLAHNVSCFDEEKFLEFLKETGPLISQFDKFYHVFMKDKFSTTSPNTFFLGLCLLNLEIYGEAINYFKKALDHFKHTTHCFDICLCLISAYFLNGNFDKAFDKCEYMWKQLDITKISKNIPYHIFRINMCVIKLFNQQRKSNKAICISPKLKLIDKDFYRLPLAYYMETKKYTKALELTKNHIVFPIKSLHDFWVNAAHVECLLHLYDEDKIPDIETCLVELDNFLTTHFFHVKSQYGDDYLVPMLQIIRLKLGLIWENIYEIDRVEYGLSKMMELSKEFKDICKYTTNITNERIIYELFRTSLSFTKVFVHACRNHIHIYTNRLILTEAQHYLYFTEELMERHSTLRVKKREKLAGFANEFLNYLLDFTLADTTLTTKERIELMLDILSLIEQYDFNKVSVLSQLGNAYKSLARDYYFPSKDCDQSRNPEEAVLSINNAIKYYSLALECKEEKISPNERTLVLDFQLYVVLAKCYSTKSRFEFDSKAMVESLLYCDELLTLPLPENCKSELLQLKSDCEMYLWSINDFLVKTFCYKLTNLELHFPESELSLFLRKRFDIELLKENSVYKLIYHGTLTVPEHENRFKTEIRYSSKEFILLCQFYKFLKFSKQIHS